MFSRSFFQLNFLLSPHWRTPLNEVINPRFRLSRIIFTAAMIFLLLTATSCNNSPTNADVSQPENTATPIPPTQVTDTPRPTITQSPTETPSPAVEDTSTPSPTATFTPSPTLPANNVIGIICFPGGVIPEMTIYLEETENGTLVELPVESGQTTFKANLLPGTYIAYAWLKDFSRGGLYSRAVPCGSGIECDDHSLLPFTIEMGEVIEGVDICDWFAGPFNVPYPPGIERAKFTGNVTGSISYIEDEEIPRLRVVAFNQNTEYWYWLYTQPGQTS